MRLNPDGEALIKQTEGCVLWSYDDKDPHAAPFHAGQKLRGTLTVGWGHTGKDVHPDQRITLIEAQELFEHDVEEVEDEMEPAVRETVNDNEWSALVSFAFNLGIGALRGSTLLRKLNAGDHTGAAAEFPKWDMWQGQHNAAIHKRRLAEQNLFLKAAP